MVKRILYFIASIVLVIAATAEFRTPAVDGSTENTLSSPPVEAESALMMKPLPEPESSGDTPTVPASPSVDVVPIVAKRISQLPAPRALWPKHLLAPDIASGNLDDKTMALLKYEQGLNQFQTGHHYEEALATLNESITLNPDQAETYFLRGGLHWHIDNYGPAIDDFTSALDLGLETSSVYYFRGRAYLEAQDFAAADADLTQAIELNADDGYAHFYRWETRNHLNQYMDAVNDAHRAMDIDFGTFYPHIFGAHRCDVNGCGSVDKHIEPHRHIVALPEDHHQSPVNLPEQ